MSNSAVNLKILDYVNFPSDVVAVDWYLYRGLLKENQAIFTYDMITYYRQYDNNTIGLKNDGKYKFWWEK